MSRGPNPYRKEALARFERELDVARLIRKQIVSLQLLKALTTKHQRQLASNGHQIVLKGKESGQLTVSSDDPDIVVILRSTDSVDQKLMKNLHHDSADSHTDADLSHVELTHTKSIVTDLWNQPSAFGQEPPPRLPPVLLKAKVR